jgi:hypothetical protein
MNGVNMFGLDACVRRLEQKCNSTANFVSQVNVRQAEG